MEWFERNPDVPGGGHARSSGGCYHLSFRSGSRANGSCASAAHDYITRSEEYDDPDRDAAIYVESDHMPEWAEDDAREYWDAADVYERANGRLYISADFAIPRDLDTEDQVALAHAFAQELTGEERLPYTLAIHAGRDADGCEHNPHAHVMISERQNDGVSRPREQWFRRADSVQPKRGGAPKSRTFHGREWMEHARKRWAELTNRMLEHRGRKALPSSQVGTTDQPRLTWRREVLTTTGSGKPSSAHRTETLRSPSTVRSRPSKTASAAAAVAPWATMETSPSTAATANRAGVGGMMTSILGDRYLLRGDVVCTGA